jgi:hypothetical protein
MIEAEFVVQGLQMRERVWEPNWGDAVEKLVRKKCIVKRDAESSATTALPN